MIEMFKYPTINALSQYLSRETDDQPLLEKSFDRAKKQKEAMQRQRTLMRRGIRKQVI